MSDNINKSVGGAVAAKQTRPVSAKARELLQHQTNGLPVWVRPPKSGLEFYSGLSRAKLYQLASTGAIRSVSIREKNAIKGTRLFNLASIFSHIEKCERGAADEAAKATIGKTVNA